MSGTAVRIIRIPVIIAAVWGILAVAVPPAMARYPTYVLRPGIACRPTSDVVRVDQPMPLGCRDLAELYDVPFTELFVDSMFRSLSLLVGAAVVALTLGSLLGVSAALLRHRAFASGGIIGATTLLTAVPAFFVAYFLQVLVVVLGASAEGGRLLPVFGFGYDSHFVLPLIAVSLPAIAYTAQLTAVRTVAVLDSDFITAANAKGLRSSWILAVHVLPHVRPVLLEGVGSGLRVSVASLPIIEYLFLWRGIGQLALEAVGIHDAPAFIFSAVVLAGFFATLSALADLSRPRALYAMG